MSSGLKVRDLHSWSVCLTQQVVLEWWTNQNNDFPRNFMCWRQTRDITPFELFLRYEIGISLYKDEVLCIAVKTEEFVRPMMSHH
jgi:hypothetical protein